MIASRNRGKIKEIKSILEDLAIEWQSLNDYQDMPEIVEDGRSFFDNALKKARAVSEFTGEMALADDSGLEVDVLDGEPGIYSARYAGETATDEDNNRKLLARLANVPPDKRTAAFRCVLMLYHTDGHHEHFEGRWCGRIHHEPVGTNGFGYDPIVFLPDHGITVAQLPDDEKNKISHRAQALGKLKISLQNINH